VKKNNNKRNRLLKSLVQHQFRRVSSERQLRRLHSGGNRIEKLSYISYT